MSYIKIFSIIFIIAVICILLIIINYMPGTSNISSLNNSTPIIEQTNNSTINNLITTVIPTLYLNNTDNTSVQPVNSDDIFNNINWSRYPNLDRVTVRTNEISPPTSVINHSHIWFVVDVTIKDPEATGDLFREMAGIAMEIRQMIGPNSSPDVYAIKNGYIIYNVGMAPYDDRIYASDHYHPQAYKNDIYLIPGDDIYDYHSYTLINNSVVEP